LKKNKKKVLPVKEELLGQEKTGLNPY